MVANPFFSGRIPQSLYDAIENYRQQSGESKTHILVKALASYINYPLEKPEPANSSRLEALENRVFQLERWIATIHLQAERQVERIEVIPQGQMSLDDIQPLETTSSNSEDAQPVGETVISPDNKDDNKSPPNIKAVIELDNDSDNTSKGLIMPNQEVANFLGWNLERVRARHKRGQAIEEKGRYFKPVRHNGRPAWEVTTFTDQA